MATHVLTAFFHRPLLLIGGLAMAFFLYMVAGIATIAEPNQAEKNTMVASFILFGASYALSWAPM
jgi:SP family sugar:H+ symporter-like MFS transporter